MASATWYYLWVNDSGAEREDPAVGQRPPQAGCAAGTGTCSVTPSIGPRPRPGHLVGPDLERSGLRPLEQRDGASPSPAGQTPLRRHPRRPHRTGIAATPIYTWNAVPGATWYELWVNDSAQARKIDTWYTAAGVGCAAGTGTCVVSPSTPLAPGRRHLVDPVVGRRAGTGPGAQGMAFTVSHPRPWPPW